MKLQPATINDAELLVDVRTPDSARTKVTVEGTREWIQKDDPNRLLFIAKQYGKSIGTVRSDFKNGKYELSYALLPQFWGKGLGSAMVSNFVNKYLQDKPLRCIIKKGNVASEKIAEQYQLTPTQEESDGYVVWENV